VIGKKGITPIISSILLILFAVGLGTLVMGWGAIAREQAASCTGAGLDIIHIAGDQQICREGSTLVMTIENSGTGVIEALKLNSITDSEIISTQVPARLKVAEPKRLSAPLGAISGTLRQVRIVPLVSREESGICAGAVVVVEGIKECT